MSHQVSWAEWVLILVSCFFFLIYETEQCRGIDRKVGREWMTSGYSSPRSVFFNADLLVKREWSMCVRKQSGSNTWWYQKYAINNDPILLTKTGNKMMENTTSISIYIKKKCKCIFTFLMIIKGSHWTCCFWNFVNEVRNTTSLSAIQIQFLLLT